MIYCYFGESEFHSQKAVNFSGLIVRHASFKHFNLNFLTSMVLSASRNMQMDYLEKK